MRFLVATLLAVSAAMAILGGDAGPSDLWVVSKMPFVKFAPANYRGRPFETEHAIRYAISATR